MCEVRVGLVAVDLDEAARTMESNSARPRCFRRHDNITKTVTPSPPKEFLDNLSAESLTPA